MSNTSHAAGDGEILTDDQDSQPASAGVLELAVDERPSSSGAWTDLAMQVPNTVPDARIAAFVETALVECRHEPVGAVYQATHPWGTVETVTIHQRWTTVDVDGGNGDADVFLRVRRDPRLGTHVATWSRADVRAALVERLSRDLEGDAAPVEVDEFAVKSLSAIEL